MWVTSNCNLTKRDRRSSSLLMEVLLKFRIWISDSEISVGSAIKGEKRFQFDHQTHSPFVFFEIAFRWTSRDTLNRKTIFVITFHFDFGTHFGSPMNHNAMIIYWNFIFFRSLYPSLKVGHLFLKSYAVRITNCETFGAKKLNVP